MRRQTKRIGEGRGLVGVSLAKQEFEDASYVSGVMGLSRSALLRELWVLAAPAMIEVCRLQEKANRLEASSKASFGASLASRLAVVQDSAEVLSDDVGGLINELREVVNEHSSAAPKASAIQEKLDTRT